MVGAEVQMFELRCEVVERPGLCPAVGAIRPETRCDLFPCGPALFDGQPQALLDVSVDEHMPAFDGGDEVPATTDEPVRELAGGNIDVDRAVLCLKVRRVAGV